MKRCIFLLPYTLHTQWIIYFEKSNMRKSLFSEIMCSIPESVEHGKVVSSVIDSDVKVSQTVSFECASGFEMDGLETLECLEDGTWSDLPPTCQPVPCTQPPV